ncbi:hypothetical protein [Geobacter sp.]|uniref:phage tail tube protein n=1 Tax=Geobacter sp. TaxID=46610 RepID=UPI00262397C1|nr:hypothetical protein [Geobacter sp.]
MLTKRRVVVAKIETVEGTPEALVAGDGGIIAIDAKWTPDIKMLSRAAAIPTLSKLQDIPGLALSRIQFKTELMGRTAAFAAGNLPYVSPFLRACGFAETLVTTPSAETVTYAPASTGLPSLTIGLYSDGVIKKIAGARGTVKFTGNVGEQIWAEFDFLGAYIAPVAGAMLSPTFPSHLPPRLTGANFTVGAFSPTLKSFEIDMGNKLAPRENMNSASGYKSFMLSDRDPRGKFDPEMEAIATHDWYGRWLAGTSGALNIGAIGSAQYNKVQITAPKLAYVKVAEGDREGIELANTDFQLAMNTGDDEISIEFL